MALSGGKFSHPPPALAVSTAPANRIGRPSRPTYSDAVGCEFSHDMVRTRSASWSSSPAMSCVGFPQPLSSSAQAVAILAEGGASFCCIMPARTFTHWSSGGSVWSCIRKLGLAPKTATEFWGLDTAVLYQPEGNPVLVCAVTSAAMPHTRSR